MPQGAPRLKPLRCRSGHDLIRYSAKKRFDVFLYSALALYSGFGVLVPLGLYKWVLRSPWWLAIAVVCGAQCVVVGAALRLARRGSFQQSTRSFVSVIGPSCCSLRSLCRTCCQFWVLGALVPVSFAVYVQRLEARAAFHGDQRRLRTGSGCASTVSECFTCG